MKLLSSGWTVNPRIAAAPPELFAPPATHVTTPGESRPDKLMQWARRVIEKVKASNIKWVPWLDDLTEENDTHRNHYRPMLREPTIKAGLKKKVLAIAALEPQCHAEDPDDPRQKEAAEFTRFALSAVPGGSRGIAVNTLMLGLIDGCSVCEPVWQPEPISWGKWYGKRAWRAYKGKPTEHLRLMQDEYKNVISIQGLGPNSGQSWRAEGFVIWSHDKLLENVQGLSDLRACYRDFWLKQQALEFRSLYLERYSLPYLKGTYTSDTQKASLEAALEEAKGGTWVTAPLGVTVEALEMGMRGTADFQAAIDNCDRNMLIAIEGSYLSTLEGQVTDGRGNTGIHKEVGELFQWMLAAELSDAITTQMIPPLYRVNYPDVPPCRVTWGAVNESAIAAWIDNNLKLQQLGVPLSKREAYVYCGRQEPADADDTLTPPALAPAGPALPFGEDAPEPPQKYIDAAVQQLAGKLNPGG